MKKTKRGGLSDKAQIQIILAGMAVLVGGAFGILNPASILGLLIVFGLGFLYGLTQGCHQLVMRDSDNDE